MNQPAVHPHPEPPGKPSALWLRRGDQLFVGTLVIAAISLMGLYGLRLTGWGQPLIEIDRLPARQYDYQLDINQAPWVEWTLLDGIGEKMARRIIAFRDEHGPFKTIEDVRNVPGIGPKTWEQICPWLMIGKSPNQPALNK
jgi:competence ComEA-like helix-hairpin-helix protein